MTPRALAVCSSLEGKKTVLLHCPCELGNRPSARLPLAPNSSVQDQIMCIVLEPHPVLGPLGPADTLRFPKLLGPSWPVGSEVLRAKVLSHFELICLSRPFHKKLASDTDLWILDRSSRGQLSLCLDFPLYVFLKGGSGGGSESHR